VRRPLSRRPCRSTPSDVLLGLGFDLLPSMAQTVDDGGHGEPADLETGSREVVITLKARVLRDGSGSRSSCWYGRAGCAGACGFVRLDAQQGCHPVGQPPVGVAE
jgi:hypothetical protein